MAFFYEIGIDHLNLLNVTTARDEPTILHHHHHPRRHHNPCYDSLWTLWRESEHRASHVQSTAETDWSTSSTSSLSSPSSSFLPSSSATNNILIITVNIKFTKFAKQVQFFEWENNHWLKGSWSWWLPCGCQSSSAPSWNSDKVFLGWWIIVCEGGLTWIKDVFAVSSAARFSLILEIGNTTVTCTGGRFKENNLKLLLIEKSMRRMLVTSRCWFWFDFY